MFDYATPMPAPGPPVRRRDGRSQPLGHAPPGWPDHVRPPGIDGWQVSATEYLLDCCPADFRRYPVLRRHPLVLAQFAKVFVEGQCRSAHEGLAGVRTGLERLVEPSVIQAAGEAWLEQEARLVRTRRAVELIDQALRGRVFVPRL